MLGIYNSDDCRRPPTCQAAPLLAPRDPAAGVTSRRWAAWTADALPALSLRTKHCRKTDPAAGKLAALTKQLTTGLDTPRPGDSQGSPQAPSRHRSPVCHIRVRPLRGAAQE
jgi:hypothetical protein